MSSAVLELSGHDRLIDIKEVSYMAGLKRATIYKWINEGKFPKPLKVGEKASRWRLSDILNWMANLPRP